MVLGFTPFSAGTMVNDFLGIFGAKGGKAGAILDMLTGNPIGALTNLQDHYMELAMGRGTGPMERQLLQSGLMMPTPTYMMPQMMPMAGGGYAYPERMDLAGGASHAQFLGYMDPNRRDAARFERMLNTNPYARASFEQAVGGVYVPDGRNDGVITVQRFAPGFAPIPGFAQNPLANSTLGMLAGMQQSVLQQAAMLGLGGAAAGGLLGLATGNPFGGLVLGGLTGVAGSLLGIGNPMAMMGGGGGIMPPFGGGFGLGGAAAGGLLGLATGNPFGGLVLGGLTGVAGSMLGLGNPLAMMAGGGGILPPFGGVGFGVGGLGSPIGGLGAGSWNPLAMPGRINNTNPAYEAQHQAEVDSVLRDPSLTVEDKITLMLMLIMKKMDKDIERQAEYINSIQQQQANRGKGKGILGGVGGIAGMALGGPVGGMIGSSLGGAVGGGIGGGQNGNPSVDVESQKLARMVQKRNQMFDILRSIIDKYNETAKGIIQSLGR